MRLESIVLIHSPLVGPYSWELVGQYFRKRGLEVIIPKLSNACPPDSLLTQFHIHTICSKIKEFSSIGNLTFVSHSGAGVLLPLLYQEFAEKEPKLIFVDSDLPKLNKSRLDLFPKEEAKQFRDVCEDGKIPLWNEKDLEHVIYNESIRKKFVDEFVEVPLALYEEPINFNLNYLNKKHGYLLLSDSYMNSLHEAVTYNWEARTYMSNHFAILNEPEKIGELILDIGKKL